MELGTATQNLSKNDAGEYTLRFESSASFLFLSDKRSETSVFNVNEDELLVPQHYRYKRTGTGKDKNTTIRFSASDNQIVVNQDEVIPWQDETDNQLFHLDIRRRIASGESRFTYSTINEKGNKDEETFAVTGKERLTLPMGEIDTVKLHKVRENSKRETLIWLAPQLDYQMVRLQQLKDGKEQLDIQLNTYSHNNKK
ncbi:hypothetical protein GCM10011357_04930 [Lacimicrobium alkaliphilum]|uniref:DUF3108 domain-containing protein n=2 Tax=Lacimicrobium alkaliphilum TaxID=1526571 RepID=A0ABQ1QYR3_9ALTE|nr:hypothetical protein GCM10011357_04930 [Lacimicrobium alkaliphilum]